MTSPTPLSLPPPDLPPLLDIRELSEYLGVPVSTIYDWRSRGVGLRAYRFGKYLKFAVTDVTEWIEAQRGRTARSPRDRDARFSFRDSL